MSLKIIHYKDRCEVCKKRKGTKLCDFVVDEFWTSIDFQTHHFTCDTKLCDRCAIHLGGVTHFCPKHAAEARRRLWEKK